MFPKINIFKNLKRRQIYKTAIAIKNNSEQSAFVLASMYILYQNLAIIKEDKEIYSPEEFFEHLITATEKSQAEAKKYPRRVALLHHCFLKELEVLK